MTPTKRKAVTISDQPPPRHNNSPAIWTLALRSNLAQMTAERDALKIQRDLMQSHAKAFVGACDEARAFAEREYRLAQTLRSDLAAAQERIADLERIEKAARVLRDSTAWGCDAWKADNGWFDLDAALKRARP